MTIYDLSETIIQSIWISCHGKLKCFISEIFVRQLWFNNWNDEFDFLSNMVTSYFNFFSHFPHYWREDNFCWNMFESDWGYAINSVEGGGRQGTDSTRKISYFKTWSYSGSADTSTISNFWQASSSGMHIVIIDNIFQKKPSHLFFFFFFSCWVWISVRPCFIRRCRCKYRSSWWPASLLINQGHQINNMKIVREHVLVDIELAGWTYTTLILYFILQYT